MSIHIRIQAVTCSTETIHYSFQINEIQTVYVCVCVYVHVHICIQSQIHIHIYIFVF